MSRHKVLFFAEAVTLAHVARPTALASAVASRYATVIARAPWAARFIEDPLVVQRDLSSIPSGQFLGRLSKGQPVYSEAELRGYVEADLALIDTERPALVVGDFRLSLSVSARLRNIPYVTITNAVWSPWYRGPPVLPVLPWTRHLPLPLARALFALARGPAMALHVLPLNRVRRHFGLPRLGWRLREAYSDADWLAIADSPDIYPTPGAPDRHRHIGPIAWSPTLGGLPAPWLQRADNRPIAYLSLGSSGAADQTATVVAGLLAAGLDVWHSTAGRGATTPDTRLSSVLNGGRERPSDTGPSPTQRVFSAPWLPGKLACQHARLVVCNGGSLGVQQALAAERPVLGIASNMDQFMNMAPIVDAGAGLLLRADRLSVPLISAAARRLIEDDQARLAAGRLGHLQAKYMAAAHFGRLIGEICSSS